MIYKNFFSKTATREAIIKSIKKDGFEPELVENEPAGKNGCKYYWSERLVNLSGDLGKQRR